MIVRYISPLPRARRAAAHFRSALFSRCVILVRCHHHLLASFTILSRTSRSNDYATWAAVTAAWPVGFVWIEKLMGPPRLTGRPPATIYNLRHHLLSSVFLGSMMGFLIAYSQSSFRFMGLKENRREYERDHAELSARIKEGLLPYGQPTKGNESSLRAAHYNSMNSQFNLGIVPWFNLAHHPWHGRDLEDYSKPCDWQAAYEAANKRDPLVL